MKRIFISYRRRTHSMREVQAISAHLRSEYGAGDVFLDVDDIAPGQDFLGEIQRQLLSCSVVVALIGPDGWRAHREDPLDDELDFGRTELSFALDRKIRVIPVLFAGADWLQWINLPNSLSALGELKVFQVSEREFEADMQLLVQALREIPGLSAAVVEPAAASADSLAFPSDEAVAHVSWPTVPRDGPPSEQKVGNAVASEVHPQQRLVQESSPKELNGLAKKRGAGGHKASPEVAIPATDSLPEQLANFPPPWASAWGDDAHGLWADLYVGESAAPVVQRLRWIAPGSFLMGSPASEPERYDDEGPQHAVRISAGFWLADSACTQALWLAVMGGKNPARFTEDTQCPVEQVSFDEVQGFLIQLTEQLPANEQAVLPTEAQWEYACRADSSGKNTPFSFGENISTEQVNYDGNAPYNKGRKGEYRERTVPVNSLPPNDWGLFEMHGNVWEWCADGMREYQAVPDGQVVLDPEGPMGEGPEARRAVRGGSWIYVAGRCRSAYRYAFRRGSASGFLGFRFALRSTSTSQAQPSAPAGA
jgi:formylglycine-generating enzyme required for sulfatase activity